MKLIDLSFCSSHYSSPEIKPKQDSGHGGEKATSMAWIVQNMKPTCFGIKTKKNKKNKMKKKKKKNQKHQKEKRNQKPKKTVNSKGLITLEERLPISPPTMEKDKGRSSARGSYQVRSGEDQMYSILSLQIERLFSGFEPATSKSHDSNLTVVPMFTLVEKDNSNKNISEEEEEEDYGLKHVGSGRRAYVSRHDSMEYSTVSLEELLNSSDCNTSMDTESMSYYSDSISRDFSNISLEKLLKDARLEVEEKEIMYSFNGSQSGKEKKKVRFRLPEASDIFILNSPQSHVMVDSKE